MVNVVSKKCVCGNYSARCLECVPFENLIKKPGICSVCGEKHLGRNRRLTSGVCFECDKDAPKRTQNIIWDMIKKELPLPSATRQYVGTSILDKEKCQVDRRRQPDAAWVTEDRIVMLEIDEDSHEEREIACELAKLDETRYAAEAGTKPCITIRFNPDAYDHKHVALDERCTELIVQILHYLQCPARALNPNGANVVYMYYHSKAQKHIDAAAENADTITIQDIVR